MMNLFPSRPSQKSATQCGNVDREIGRLDKDVGPDASHQLLLGNQIAGTFQQNNQDFQRAASEMHRLIPFQQKKLSGEQSKRPE